MAIELLIIIGIFAGGVVVAHIAAGTAMKNLEHPGNRDRDQRG